MARGVGLERSGRIRQQSDQRLSEHDERAAVRERVFRRDHWTCRAKTFVPSVECDGVLDAHEVIPRSAWPGGHLVEENILTVCRAHHRWIDANPIEAAQFGLHGFSWERP